MNKKTGLITIFTAGIIILILIVSNFDIDVKQKNQKTIQSVEGLADNSMSGHHEGSVSINADNFNNLVDKSAPDFTLESYDGKKITLSELKGRKVILFFNEGLMCYPSCWNQISAFGRDTDLNSKAVILNITVDPKNEWVQAVKKMPELAQSVVVFDSERVVSQKYGVLTLPSSMHKGQFPGHSYILIDEKGIVKFVKDDPQMAVRNQEMSLEIDKL